MTNLDTYIRGRAKMRRLAESGDMWTFTEREIDGKAFTRIEAEPLTAEIDLPLALLGKLAVATGGSLTMCVHASHAHVQVLLVGPLEAIDDATMQNGETR
jgi:hypothetical protein